MREEYMLAMHRDSVELELELIDRRVDEAFAHVYEYLEPAADYLRSVCDEQGCRALERLERAYQRAVELAARSGLGLRATRAGASGAATCDAIPTTEQAALVEHHGAATGTDTVLDLRAAR